MATRVDTTEWPVVRARMGGASDEELDVYFAETRRYLLRGERFVSITWIDGFKNTAEQRRRVADFIKETEPLSKKLCVASANIASSAGFRFALSALLLLRPLPMPYKVCETLDEALDFLRPLAKKNGLVLPAVSELAR
jgi:hypothetical protein